MKKLLVLFFVLFSFTMASAQVDLQGAGGHLSLVMPDNVDNTIGIGGHVDLGSIITPEVTLHGYLDFWRKSEKEEFVKISFTSINIFALGKYNFDIDQTFTPYAGAGLGFEIGSGKVEIEGTGLFDSSESETDFELILPIVGGAKMPITDEITGFAEFRYHIGGSDTFYLTVGATWAL